MEQYIPKSALVAEIKKLRDTAFELYGISQFNSAYNNVLKSIDTLEVKEVDLDTEIMKYQREIYDRDTTVRDVAKYFFELGIKAKKGE